MVRPPLCDAGLPWWAGPLWPLVPSLQLPRQSVPAGDHPVPRLVARYSAAPCSRRCCQPAPDRPGADCQGATGAIGLQAGRPLDPADDGHHGLAVQLHARIARRLSVSDLAERVGVSQASYISAGNSHPKALCMGVEMHKTSIVAGSPHEMRQRIVAIVAASSGNLVEWYDFYAYAFTALYFAHAFFPSSDPTVQLLNTAAIFAIGFLMRPLGGWLFGRLGDRTNSFRYRCAHSSGGGVSATCAVGG